MGTKYASIASSGYNSSPPADDGSQTASNLITWAAQKTKLGDPIKTLADSINTALVTAFDYSVRQITTSDNTVAGDHMKCVEIAPTVTTAVTVSLGDAATMTNNYRVFVKNSSARNQTVSRVTGGDTIDGVAGSITLPPLAGAIFQTNSTPNGYLTSAWFGPFSDGSPVVSGGTDGTKKVRIEVDGLTTATTRVWTAADLDISIGKQPTRQVFLSGSGTYNTPAGATRINARLVGAGGGGGTTAGTGGNTTFSTLTGSGGVGAGAQGASGGIGGAAAGGDINIPGGGGAPAHQTSVANVLFGGGSGGNSAFGGGGGGGAPGSSGVAGATNSGGGGGGDGTGSATNGRSGGGAGGYVEKLITAPASTYSYGVGAAGSAGTSGAAGAAGIIIVDEWYN